MAEFSALFPMTCSDLAGSDSLLPDAPRALRGQDLSMSSVALAAFCRSAVLPPPHRVVGVASLCPMDRLVHSVRKSVE